MTILKSDKYQQELERLIADPIIIEMTRDIHYHGQHEQFLQDDSWETMSLTNKQYQMLGGANSISIGGPQRAVKHLLYFPNLIPKTDKK